MTDYTIAVLEDAISILKLLGDKPEGLSLSHITNSSGFVKNKVFRILYTLEKHQMVERKENGDYQLGGGLLALSQSIHNQTVLIDASRSVMDRLVVETSESIFLGVISGCDALCIATRESPRSVRLFAQVGRRAPLHSGGVPKVLFAHLPQEEKNSLLDHFFAECDTIPGTNLTRPVLEHQLTEIRSRGYAIVANELNSGAHSIAAPIRNHHGNVIAAISIAGPSSRFTDEAIARYVRLVVAAAGEISQLLGYQREYTLNGDISIPQL